ncbi:MAG TPA: Gfo/Idh/MocA family oxidoreductase [Terriglobales bacterium]|nr:Gfo/Idh/MocA family oxidoreductase [Terriglobales bacterium]
MAGSRVNRTIQVGLIGAGNISETHARAARAIPDLGIAAIYGSNPEKVRRLVEKFGGQPYAKLDDFLNHRPMDFVAIGSPSGLHAAQGIAAAERGLHVLTEKPIDISLANADALIRAAHTRNVKLGVMFQDRFKPEIRKLKRWIEQGVLGKLLLADARVKWYRPPEYYANSKWRGTLELDGGGALINQAVHTVDLLLWLMGDVIGVQSSVATGLHKIEAEDLAVALLEFSSGARGILQASTAIFPGYPRRIEITGTEGTLILEHDRVVAVDLRNQPEDVRPGTPSADTENLASPVVSDFSGHQAIFEDFIRAIEEDRAPLCDGEEARRSLVLVEEIYRAAGRTLPVARLAD